MRFFRAWAASMKRAYPGLKIQTPGSFTPRPGSTYDQILARGRVGGSAITRDSMAKQLGAFGSDLFELQVLAPPELKAAEPEKLRDLAVETLTADEVMKRQGFLAARNAEGYGVYIRPAPIERDGDWYGQPWILVDDLTAEKVGRLKRNKLTTNIVVETSHENFQGWIRVGTEPVPRKILTRAAKIVAQAIGADIKAADWRHHGRLAGFTNTKPQRLKDGKRPFSKIWASQKHRVAEAGPALLDLARRQIEQEARDLEMQRRTAAERLEQARIRARLEGRDVVADLIEARARLGHGGDESAKDLRALMSALRKGHDPAEAVDALRTVSPDLEERHANVEDYLRRTLDRALEYLGSDPNQGPRR